MNQKQRRAIVLGLSLIIFVAAILLERNARHCDWDGHEANSLYQFSSFKFCQRHYDMAQAIHRGEK